jgi:hypothetical protein
MKKDWYAVTVLFCSYHGDVPSLRPLCEERVVLFRGGSEKVVRRAAIAYGKAEMHSYQNLYGELVEWKFIGIERVEILEPPRDANGWEVASRFVRRSARTLRDRSSRPT